MRKFQDYPVGSTIRYIERAKKIEHEGVVTLRYFHKDPRSNLIEPCLLIQKTDGTEMSVPLDVHEVFEFDERITLV